MDREYGNKKKVHMKENIRETENPPLGLSVLEPNEELDMLFMLALNETENVLSNECSNQIASNQHFFINYPFPLNHGRESGTPLFTLDSPRVVSLVALVMKTFQAFQLSTQEINDLLPRSNIIVREYRVGQQISFHVDELECDSQVFGFILLNESPKQNGLMFRKGEDKVTMNYTLKEKAGTMFHLTDEARYKWKHGLKSVEARRISVTIRIFKNSYLNNKNISNVEALIENDSDKIGEMPKWMIEDSSDEEEAEKAANKPSGNNNKIRIQVCKNNNRTITKPALLDSPVKLNQLKQIVKNKLGVNGKKYYFANGEEVIEGVEIIDDIVIYVSQGEGFTGAKQSKGQENKMNAKLKALKKDYFLGQRLIHEKIIWWNNYKFGKLKFKAIKCTDADARPHDDDTVTVDSMVELGLNLQKSHLTIPEFRDLIHTLRAIVDERSNHLWWTFRTSVWEDGRSSSVGIKYWNPEPQESEGPSPYEGMWVEFEARGDKAYKGAKKRDGELWALEGGLNNPFDKEKEKEKKEKEEKVAQKKEEIEEDSGSDDDENSEEDQLSVKSGKKNKQLDPNVISNTPRINDKKNKYQKKRGVIFTPDYVFFAGTVWCSSYYTCKILSENVTYTSATQLVMADQARLFGDEKRLSQILSSSFDPAPHKAFDHKAPKTGQRKVLHFNSEVWEKHKLRLMWKATYEKFNQNMALKNRMLQTVGERSFVEATDDFVWGIGLALDHPDVANPAKWRAPNAMGVILTAVYKLILMEFESPPFSLERITYLEANSKSIPSDNFQKRLLTFISTIEESGDTERFKAPSWTSIKSVHEVKEWISKSQPLSLDHLFGLMTSYLKLTEEQRNNDSDNTLLGNVEWYQSLLYLIEGALGFRKF